VNEDDVLRFENRIICRLGWIGRQKSHHAPCRRRHQRPQFSLPLKFGTSRWSVDFDHGGGSHCFAPREAASIASATCLGNAIRVSWPPSTMVVVALIRFAKNFCAPGSRMRSLSDCAAATQDPQGHARLELRNSPGTRAVDPSAPCGRLQRHGSLIYSYWMAIFWACLPTALPKPRTTCQS
jgi:hypothetical protein